jgi:ssDNA-specific exonuclease RecJ
MQEKGTEQSMLLLSTLCFLEELISFLNNVFLDLGFKSIDCTEMSWIESILYF